MLVFVTSTVSFIITRNLGLTRQDGLVGRRFSRLVLVLLIYVIGFIGLARKCAYLVLDMFFVLRRGESARRHLETSEARINI